MLNLNLKQSLGVLLPLALVVLALSLKWGHRLTQENSLQAQSMVLQETEAFSDKLNILSKQIDAALDLASESEASYMQSQQAGLAFSAQSKLFQESDFKSLFFVKRNRLKKWKLSWGSNKNSVKEKITREVASKYLAKQLPFSSTQKTRLVYSVANDLNGEKVVAVLKRKNFQSLQGSEQGVIVGFLPVDFFMGLLQEYESNFTEAYILANKKIALAHEDWDYLGAKMDTHPAVSSLSQNQEQSFKYKIDSEERRAALETVPGTNLSLLTGTRLGLRSFWTLSEVVYLLIVVIIAGALGVYLLAQGDQQRLTRRDELLALEKAVVAISDGGGIARFLRFFKSNKKIREALLVIEEKAQKKTEPVQALLKDEKIDKQTSSYLLKKISKGFQEELSLPLNSIYGSVQKLKLARNKELSKQVIGEIEMAVTETRNFFDSINYVASEAPNSRGSVALDRFLETKISQKQSVLSQKGFRLEKDFARALNIQIDEKIFSKSMDFIFEFVISLLSTRADREFKLIVKESSHFALISFESPGFQMGGDIISELNSPLELYEQGIEKSIYLAFAEILIKELSGSMSLINQGDEFIIQIKFLSSGASSKVEAPKNNLVEMMNEPSRDEVDEVVGEIKEDNLEEDDSFVGFNGMIEEDMNHEEELDDFVMVKPKDLIKEEAVKEEEQEKVQIRKPKLRV